MSREPKGRKIWVFPFIWVPTCDIESKIIIPISEGFQSLFLSKQIVLTIIQ